MKKERKMWQHPWRYKESIAFILGIIIIGFILQIIAGNVDFSLFQFPVNIIVGGVIILIMIIFRIKRKSYFVRWFSGVPLSVTLIGALLILGFIMGLTPQVIGESPIEKNIFQALGFDRMTSSWAFVLVYFFTLLTLGTLISRRLIPFHIKDYAFYFNHIGLWILLFSAGLGASDMRRYVMHIREGEVEWRVYSENKDVLELPIAIQLNDFYMEEYPPKLAVINRNTSKAQPEEDPLYFHIDDRNKVQQIGHWEITLEEYVHDAIRNSDSTYHEIHMPGASPAAKIRVNDMATQQIKSGWVSAGNISQLYMVLNIDTLYSVVMATPEPKKFVSDINIFTEDGKKTHALLEVNKPCKMGHWMLYQYGYDNDAGRLSTYSSIELVYDPWIIPVYAGIIMVMMGSVCMLWTGNKKKEKNNDME